MTKNFLNAEQEFRFNEVLFENRNKNYGAYVIRNEEGNILRKSLFIGVAFFAAVALTPFIINSVKDPVVPTESFGPYILKPVDVEDPVVEIVKPIIPPKIIENTVKLDLPTPTRNVVKETPATSTEEIKNAHIGTETIIGEPPTIATPQVIVTNPITPPVVEKPKPVNNNPVTIVDVEASFNGGINAFRSKVTQNFDTDGFEGSGGLMKTTVTFIVEKDGTISGIKANGSNTEFNSEAEKTIKNLKGKWTPAKLNGEQVRSYFKFPISMQFE